MGFSPEKVGLNGQRISGKFEEWRPKKKCPHKGIDITCSLKSLPFTAGVYGTVRTPLGGKWGTISISPMHSPQTIIQYLHNSKIDVKVGDKVAPWTHLGLTGKKAAELAHLHIHIIEPGNSKHKCWKTKAGAERNFVNPEKWGTPDLMQGNWQYESRRSWNRTIRGHTYTYRNHTRRLLTINSTTNGSTQRMQIISVTTIDGTSCHCTRTGNISLKSKREKNFLRNQGKAEGCNSSGNCGCGPCKIRAGETTLYLKSRSELVVAGAGGSNTYNRTSLTQLDPLEIESYPTAENAEQPAFFGNIHYELSEFDLDPLFLDDVGSSALEGYSPVE